MKKQRSLFTKYFLSVTAMIVLMLLASAGLGAWFSYQEVLQHQKSLQSVKAEAAAYRVGQFIGDIAQQVSWTESPGMGMSDAAQLRQRHLDYLKLLRQAPIVTDVSWIAPDGVERLHVSRLVSRQDMAAKHWDMDAYFLSAHNGKQAYSPVFFRLNSEPYLTLMQPDRFRPGWVTAVDVNLKFALEFVERITVGREGLAYVTDDTGVLIAHPDLSLVLRKTDLQVLPQVDSAIKSEDNLQPHSVNGHDLGGRQVLSTYITVPELGWKVFVEQPMDEALSPIYDSLKRFAVLLGVGLLLSVVASSVMTRRMVRPIRQLQAGAQRLGAGKLDLQIDVRSGDELQELAEKFNQMAGRLKDAYEDLEQKVADRTRDLTTANQQLTSTLDTLQKTQRELVRTEKLASLGSMVAGVAHELNTPLGNALLATSSLQEANTAMQQLLGKGMRKSDLEQFMRDVQEATDISVRSLGIASALVQRFKEVAVDQTSEQRREFDLRDAIEGMLTVMGPTLRKQSQRVLNTVPEGVRMHSYPGSLGQVLTNMVNNALLHAFEGRSEGQITLALEDAGPDSVALVVQDNGVGMSQAVMERIFDPFFTTRMGRGGTGLGLNITLNIVENILGGTIEVSSTPGEGTRFRILMRRVAEQQADSHAIP